ncbi:MAG TPA: hypothetical protein VNG53_06255 [Bacteroidia bacterium]|nr:hypothetical protein [Bacteroidia bacterium]
MGLKRGNTNNPEGRPKGSTNKVTADLRKKINDFLSDNWKLLQNDFITLEPKDRWQFYEKLLSYGLPKLQNIRLEAKDTIDCENNKIDVSKLTDDELRQLAGIQRKLRIE